MNPNEKFYVIKIKDRFYMDIIKNRLQTSWWIGRARLFDLKDKEVMDNIIMKLKRKHHKPRIVEVRMMEVVGD